MWVGMECMKDGGRKGGLMEHLLWRKGSPDLQKPQGEHNLFKTKSLPDSGIPNLIIDHLPNLIVDHLPNLIVDHRPNFIVDHLPNFILDHLSNFIIDHRPNFILDHLPNFIVDNLPNFIVGIRYFQLGLGRRETTLFPK